jgi:hypothetical protein
MKTNLMVDHKKKKKKVVRVVQKLYNNHFSYIVETFSF